MTIVPRPSHGVCMRVPLPPLGGNGKWKMENGKLFLALALGTIDREAEQRAALFGGNGGLGGLPRLVAYANQNAPRCLSERRHLLLLEQKD